MYFLPLISTISSELSLFLSGFVLLGRVIKSPGCFRSLSSPAAGIGGLVNLGQSCASGPSFGLELRSDGLKKLFGDNTA